MRYSLRYVDVPGWNRHFDSNFNFSKDCLKWLRFSLYRLFILCLLHIALSGVRTLCSSVPRFNLTTSKNEKSKYGSTFIWPLIIIFHIRFFYFHFLQFKFTHWLHSCYSCNSNVRDYISIIFNVNERAIFTAQRSHCSVLDSDLE